MKRRKHTPLYEKDTKQNQNIPIQTTARYLKNLLPALLFYLDPSMLSSATLPFANVFAGKIVALASRSVMLNVFTRNLKEKEVELYLCLCLFDC